MQFPIWQGVIIVASTISMFAYISIVVHIFRGRKQISIYNKSFFRLCLSNFIVHFAYFIEINTYLRPLHYGLLNPLFKKYPQTLTTIMKVALCIASYLSLAASCGDVMVAANRFTSAFHPSTYEKVWTCLLWKLWAFQYITPFLIVLTTVILQPLKPLTHVSSKSHVMFNFDDGPLKYLTLIGALTAALAMILSLLMYIMTIAKMRHFRRTRIFSTNLKIKNSSHSDLEKRCMTSALLMFCGAVPHLIICVIIIAYHKSETITSFCAHLWVPAADLMISAPPWALLVKSTKLRRYFREKVETLLDAEWLNSTKKSTITTTKIVKETRSAVRFPSM